jgi:hypothetical protein
MPGLDDLQRLESIANELQNDGRWPKFAEYCSKRGRGLRLAALAVLASFLEEVEAWAFIERLHFARWSASRARRFTDRGVLLPDPLLLWLRQFLVTWAETQPSDPEPHMWLGVHWRWQEQNYCERAAHLRRALALDSGCELAAETLIDIIAVKVEDSQHELPSGYLGDPSADVAALDEALALMGRLRPTRFRSQRAAELHRLRLSALKWAARRA